MTTAAQNAVEPQGSTFGRADQLLAGAIADALLAELGGPADEESARCLTNGLVAGLGEGRLGELGLGSGVPAEMAVAFVHMTEAEVATAAEVVLGCVDVRGVMITAGVEAGLSPEGAACVADTLAQRGVVGDIVASVLRNERSALMDDPEVGSLLFYAMAECLTPEELAEIGDFESCCGGS